jgi:sulfur carrier protein
VSGATVAVTINGARHEAPSGALLVDVLRALGVDSRRIAVERNREVVPRAEQPTIVVSDGDSYEVVQFVGGG